MPSFDIVNKIDDQNIDNAVNTSQKEIDNRFDFKGTETSLDYDKKTNLLKISSNSDLKMDATTDILISKFLKQGIDPRCLDLSKESYTSGKMIKKDVTINSGIDKEQAKKLVKIIKDSGLKVQASIMDEQVRVNGKKIDDLQSVISLLKQTEFEIPLQFENMRS